MKTMVKRINHEKEMRSYLKRHNVYKPSEPVGYNIMQIARYAKRKGCKIADLSQEEVAMFATR